MLNYFSLCILCWGIIPRRNQTHMVSREGLRSSLARCERHRPCNLRRWLYQIESKFHVSVVEDKYAKKIT